MGDHIASRGIIAFVILVVIIVLIAYIETGFSFLHTKTTASSSVPTASTTILSNAVSTSTTVNYTGYLHLCNNFSLYNASFNSSVTANCISNGGTLGLWVASGNSGMEAVTITGADNKTYVNQSSSYDCITLYQNFTGPAQVYTMTLKTGPGGGSCGYAIAKLNSTTTPPSIVYNIVYNGDFGSGRYTGWTTSGAGWGASPLNMTFADLKGCYLNKTWSNYVGTFFATTYTCGLAVAPGNLTSSPFYANATKSFLNFKIISPYNSGLYVEILQNNTPRIIAHYDTFNISLGSNAVSTFSNASIPLSTLVNKAVQVRVVAGVVGGQTSFMAVGDFALSNKPIQQQGILTNMTFIGR